MTDHFRRGFADELIKLSAFSQSYNAPQSGQGSEEMKAIMSASQGSGARTGNKSGSPVPTSLATRNPAPPPITSPMDMVGHGGGG